MKERNILSPDLISAFEGSMLDLEVLFRKPASDGFNTCILLTYHFRTRPELKRGVDTKGSETGYIPG